MVNACPGQIPCCRPRRIQTAAGGNARLRIDRISNYLSYAMNGDGLENRTRAHQLPALRRVVARVAQIDQVEVDSLEVGAA